MKKRNRKYALAIMLLATGLLAGMRASVAGEEELRIQYKVGEGLNIGNGENLFHIQGRVQGRYTYTINDGATKDTSGFSVNRAEIRMDGHVLDKKLKYGFEMNLATRARATTTAVCGAPTDADGDGQIDTCTATNAVTAESTTGLAMLNDYYVDWVPAPYFGVQVGQFKVPFLMQQLTSSTKQQFVDRGLSTGFFDFSRDIGINIHGKVLNDKLNYAVFLMNGDGANSLNRNNRAPLVGARLEVPIFGKYEYSESDVGNSEEHNLGVGAAIAFNEGSSTLQSGTVAAFTKAIHGTLDAGYKYHGWSFQGAGMLTRTQEGARLTNWGYNAQVGYFVIPKTLEFAARAGGAVFSNATRNQYEYAGVVNFFPWQKGHGIKFQTDYTLLQHSGGTAGRNDHRFRVAMNLIF